MINFWLKTPISCISPALNEVLWWSTEDQDSSLAAAFWILLQKCLNSVSSGPAAQLSSANSLCFFGHTQPSNHWTAATAAS